MKNIRTLLQANNITWSKDGHASFLIAEKQITLPPASIYDTVQVTMNSLNSALSNSANSPQQRSGKTLREEFDEEMKILLSLVSSSKLREYGFYAYHPVPEILVHYAPEKFHRLALLASNSTLIMDKAGIKNWSEIKEIFDETVVGVVGASVGSNILNSIIKEIRPKHIKIADPDFFETTNANRTDPDIWDLVQNNSQRSIEYQALPVNKAVAIARKIHGIDPTINIYIYDEGIHEGNIDRFFNGDSNEPAANFIIEETDHLDTKVSVREKCKKEQKTFMMITDTGSAIVLDILDYQKSPELPMTYGVDDKLFYERYHRALNGTRDEFFDFFKTIVGQDHITGEFAQWVDRKGEIVSASLPQLASTAIMGGAIAAEAVARLSLGYEYPKRIFLNKNFDKDNLENNFKTYE